MYDQFNTYRQKYRQIDKEECRIDSSKEARNHEQVCFLYEQGWQEGVQGSLWGHQINTEGVPGGFWDQSFTSHNRALETGTSVDLSVDVDDYNACLAIINA